MLPYLSKFFQTISQFNQHFELLLTDFNSLAHVILFLTIFVETGLVVAPFLPGDILLIAVGAASANGSLQLGLIFVLLSLASFLGDNLSYWIGHLFGKLLVKPNSKSGLIREAKLKKATAFLEKHGNIVIIFAKFLPVFRALVPFAAGFGKLHYRRFLLFSATGSVVWVGGCLVFGYLFGNIPVVRAHFDLAILTVFVLLLLPFVIRAIKRIVRK